MANLGTIKKASKKILASSEWEVREICKSWEDADRYRSAIINNTQRQARVRYEQPNYIVEWRA